MGTDSPSFCMTRPTARATASVICCRPAPGQDFVLNTRDVIGVFDLDTAGASRRTEEYFRHAEAEGAVVDLCAPGTLPKSFMVTDFPDETVYISQLSPAALKKRAEKLEF